MPFLLLLIGALLFIVAYQDTHGDLAAALKSDVPPFMKWALAIAAIGALGWVPGMRDLSRWLLALVLVVIVLMNYRQMIDGLTSLAGAPAGSGGQRTPAAAAAAGQIPTQAEIEGTSGGTLVAGGAGTGAAAAAAAITTPSLNFDPSQFLSGFGIGGFL